MVNQSRTTYMIVPQTASFSNVANVRPNSDSLTYMYGVRTCYYDTYLLDTTDGIEEIRG